MGCESLSFEVESLAHPNALIHREGGEHSLLSPSEGPAALL